jgi:hypothetical protein
MPGVEVTWGGKTAEVESLELLKTIHENKENRVISLSTECFHGQQCGNQVLFWSNLFTSLKRLNQYGVDMWELKPEGYSGPYGVPKIWRYSVIFTRK